MKRKREGAEQIVVALCRDYPRRREAIRQGTVSRRTAMEYKYLNAMICEAARETVDERLALTLVIEIGEERGYAKSRVDCLSETTYKRYKNLLLHAIARKLHLED